MTGNDSDERAVNTVVDVSLALLFVGIAVSALTAFPIESTEEFDPHQADYTTDTLGGSTINVSYSVATDTPTGSDEGRADRISHGSVASQIGAAAVANGHFEDGTRLVSAGASYEQALDERVQAALVESNFRTNVTASWEPFEDAPLSGIATVGQSPPATESVSASRIRVPSGMDSVRAEATEAVEAGGGYETVAELLAHAVIEGYLPRVESKRALESNGLERTLTRQRYEQMAIGIEGVEPDDEIVAKNTQLQSVDTEAANEYLASALADQFESELAATFETPAAAANASSTGDVIIEVRSWEP